MKKNWIAKAIKHNSPEFMAGWLRGFFDGEGSAFFKTVVSGKPHTSYYLTVGNTDLSLMNIAVEYLADLGIGYTQFHKRTGSKKEMYYLHICRAEDIIKFRDLIGFNSATKQAKLEIIINWINRDRRFYRDGELRDLKSQGLSWRKIAEKMGYAEGAHNRLAYLFRKEDQSWQKNIG